MHLESTLDNSMSFVFLKGQKLYQTLLNSSENHDLTQLKEAQTALSLCVEGIDQLSMFSLNETLEDIHTNDLRFLLAYAYLGETVLLQPTGSVVPVAPGVAQAAAHSRETSRETSLNNNSRLEDLLKAESHFKSFLSLADNFELLSSPELKPWKSYFPENIKETSMPPPVKTDRQSLIDRYRKEKEIERKMNDLTLLTELSAKVEESNSNRVDEETYRQLVLCMIEYQAFKTLSSLKSLNEEKYMLTEIEKLKENRGAGSREGQVDQRQQSSVKDAKGPLLNTQGKVSSFVLDLSDLSSQLEYSLNFLTRSYFVHSFSQVNVKNSPKVSSDQVGICLP